MCSVALSLASWRIFFLSFRWTRLLSLRHSVLCVAISSALVLLVITSSQTCSMRLVLSRQPPAQLCLPRTLLAYHRLVAFLSNCRQFLFIRFSGYSLWPIPHDAFIFKRYILCTVGNDRVVATSLSTCHLPTL